MAILTLEGYGDLEVQAPAPVQFAVVGDVARAFNGVLRSDVDGSVGVWPLVAHPLLNATADTLIAFLRAGIGVPFNASGDLIGATVPMLASNIGAQKDVDAATRKTVSFTLSQVTPS